MRHLRRLYFDNLPAAHASDKFISVVDQGADSLGNQRYNIRVGDLSVPADVAVSASYLMFTSCFFKLPVGATAIVDIYIPDIDGSNDPKTFDYQVFKAKNPSPPSSCKEKALAAFRKQMSKIPVELFKMPVGYHEPVQAGGTSEVQVPDVDLGSVSKCAVEAPCGGQTEVACGEDDEPLFMIARCKDNLSLECVRREPPAAAPQKKK